MTPITRRCARYAAERLIDLLCVIAAVGLLFAVARYVVELAA